MKIKPYIFLFLTFFLSIQSFAQDYLEEERVIRDRSDFKRGLNVYAIIPAYTISSYSNINHDLVLNGYPFMKKGQLNYGFGFMYRQNRFLVGMDLFWGSQVMFREEPARAYLKRNPWTYSLNLGYHVYKRDGFAIYPQVGLNYTDTNLILSKSTVGTSFDDILADPMNSVNLYHESGGLFLGVGMDFHWLFRKESPLVSLKAGKRIQIDNPTPWESFYTPLTNAPTDSFNYWIVQLSVGGAFNWDKKGKR